MHQLAVHSETGRLRRALLHTPGLEIDRMVPSLMEELLFDDILFGEDARDEHGRMKRVLQLLGIEAFEMQELLVEVLQDPNVFNAALAHIEPELNETTYRTIQSTDPAGLALALIAGIRDRDADAKAPKDFYDLTPIPNYCFQRDPMIVLGNSLVFCPMATSARYRESWISRLVATHHPLFAGAEICWDPLTSYTSACVEGGDVLVLSPEILAIGLSERTNREGLNLLIDHLQKLENPPRWVFAVEIPRKRAYMHLDTLFTPVDQNACLTFPPVMGSNGTERGHIYEIEVQNPEHVKEVRTLRQGLAARGYEFEPIHCGGDDPIKQRREQWTDGANAMALAPGVILTYDRNVGTVEELKKHGFHVTSAEDLLLGRHELDLDNPTRTCIILQSNELSRARGGPHCLLHPLERDSLK